MPSFYQNFFKKGTLNKVREYWKPRSRLRDYPKMRARNGVNVPHFVRSMFFPAGANEIIGSRKNEFPQSVVVSPQWRVYPQTKEIATRKVTVGNGYGRPLNPRLESGKLVKSNHQKKESVALRRRRSMVRMLPENK